MKTNIALIGFMGTGKSATGKILARILKKKYVEVDFLITQEAGKSIPQIFNDEGEIGFRDKEINVIKIIACRENQLIDCGGGVVLNRINIDRLKQDAVIVWLTASPDEILRRIAPEREGRPLMKGKVKKSEIRSLLNFRKPFYERSADLVIDTSNLSIEMVASRIIRELQEYEIFNP
jgi:shikimate kinase